MNTEVIPFEQEVHPSNKELFTGFMKLGLMGFGVVECCVPTQTTSEIVYVVCLEMALPEIVRVAHIGVVGSVPVVNVDRYTVPGDAAFLTTLQECQPERIIFSYPSSGCVDGLYVREGVPHIAVRTVVGVCALNIESVLKSSRAEIY